MELRQLKIFQMVAEVRNFTRAAELLGYAQSNITTQIKLLEEEYQTKLFERLGKRVALTTDGEKLLAHANEILRLSSGTKDILSKSPVISGEIVIGIAESLCVFRLPGLFKEYCKRYPQVRLVIRLGSSADFHRWLRDNTVDVAFFLDSLIDTADLTARSLLAEPMVFVGETGHRLLAKGCIGPEDIRDECFIFTGRGCSYRAMLERYLEEAGVRPRAIYEFDSVESIKQFAAAGLGIALLPWAAVERELVENVLADLRWEGPEIGMHTQVVYHKNKWLSPTLTSMLELIGTHFPIK